MQSKLLLFAIEVGRPVEAPLNGAGLVIARREIDFIPTGIFERAKVARAGLVNSNALMRLRRRVIGFALALALLVCAGLTLLGVLLGLLGLLLGGLLRLLGLLVGLALIGPLTSTLITNRR